MRVYLLGLGEQLQNSLNFLFDKVFPGEYVFVEHDADFSIVDIDNYDGKQLLREHHAKNPGQALILLSVKEMQAQPGTNIVYLRKPFNKEQMVGAIDQARNKAAAQRAADTAAENLSKESQQSAPKTQDPSSGHRLSEADQSGKLTAVEQTLPENDSSTDTSKTAKDPQPAPAPEYRPYVQNIQSSTLALSNEDMLQLMGGTDRVGGEASTIKLEYNPDRFLSGVLLNAYRRAAKNKCRLLFKIRNYPILLDPEKKLAWLDMDSIHEKSLASIPLEKSWLEYKVLRSDEKVDIAGKPISMEALIWETALYGARGRVPKGTMLDRPVRLKHWPNFTRILLFPEAMRIAALLSEHTYSLTKTAQLLKIDERCIYSFYSAAYALGLVSIAYTEITETEELAVKPLPPVRKRILLNGILERLKTSIFSEKS